MQKEKIPTLDECYSIMSGRMLPNIKEHSEQVMNVAKAKREKYMDKTFKKSIKSVLGTALSIGATVEGLDPRVIQKKVEEGEYDDRIKEEA